MPIPNTVTVELNNANLSASTKTTNLLNATELATCPTGVPAYIISIYNVSSASGVNQTFQTADGVVINDKEIIRIGTTLNEQDHLVGEFIVPAGSPLSYFLRETAAAATTDVLTKVVAEPILE